MVVVKHAFTELPVIDIRDLAGDDLARRQAVADVIDRTVREVGSFYITSHGTDPALIAGVREAAKQVFALSTEEKMNYYTDHSRNHKGYVPEGEEIYNFDKLGHKEALDISFQATGDHPLMFAGTLLIGTNEWPDLSDFCARVLVYHDAVFALGHRLFDAFTFALGLSEGYLKLMVTCPPAKLQLIHYPFGANIEDVPGTDAHAGYERFTLLSADQLGLEVLNEESVQIDALPVKNAVGEEAFVINIDDMLEVLSAGISAATVHRVCKVPQEWCSSPLLFARNYYMLVRPLSIFLVTGETGEYQELSIGGYMWSRAL